MSKQYKVQLVAEPVDIKAALGEDGQPTGPPAFSGVAYSGGMVPGYTASPPLPHDYVIDLPGTKDARTIHANKDHDPKQRVGHVAKVDNDGKRLFVEGLLSAETIHRDEIAGGARNGQPWEVSIEGHLGGKRFVPRGQSETVNGQTFHGPFFRMTKNLFTDIAFVSHGADDGNAVKIAASAAGVDEMSDFEKFALSCGVDLETASDEQKAFVKTAMEAMANAGKPKPNKPRSFSELAAEERNERDRCEAIHRMGLEACRENSMYIDQIELAVADAIESKMSTKDFELALLRSLRTKAGTFAAHVNREVNDEVFEAALALSAGLPDIDKHYSEQTLHTVEKQGMRNFGLQELLIRVAQRNGYVARPAERINNGNIRTILEYCFPPVTARLAGAFSTINLPGILGNVANKELLAGYMEEDQTWRELATVKSVSNFHLQTAYRMLDNLEYELLPPGGMIPHGTLDQETFTRQAKTYAKMLGLERTQIINDDLGAFDDLRMLLGRGGAKKFQNIFWAAFMSNLATMFTTARTNYLAGATTNLGTDGVGLRQGVQLYRKMRSPAADGSKRVGASQTSPSILLVPPELEFTAREFYVSGNLGGGGNSTSMVPNNNIFQGLYRPVVQNRLSDTSFTGNSATAWYLFGRELKPMVVSFLNGQQTPTIESAEADFNVLGILFRGYFDFGCDPSEYLAGVMIKGAA